LMYRIVRDFDPKIGNLDLRSLINLDDRADQVTLRLKIVRDLRMIVAERLVEPLDSLDVGLELVRIERRTRAPRHEARTLLGADRAEDLTVGYGGIASSGNLVDFPRLIGRKVVG